MRERLRRVAKRPRKWLATVRAHKTTAAAINAAGIAWERAALAATGARGRNEHREDWFGLLDAVAALPAIADADLDRRIATVRVGPGASGLGTSLMDADADLVCLLPASTTPLEPGWRARLTAAVNGTTVAAAPLVVHPVRPALEATPHDGRTRARGLALGVENDAPILRAEGAGATASVQGEPEPITGATGACLLVNRRAYEAAGGLMPTGDLDLDVFDLVRRLREQGGEVVVVPTAVVVDHRAVRSRRALTAPVDANPDAWRAYVDDHGPVLFRAAVVLPAGMLRIAITVAAPSMKVAARWGDWHLAQAFARALRANGHIVRVQTLDHADDLAGRSCDVHCVIRGLAPVRRTPGQTHVLWIISHPEDVTTEDCDRADLVLVASERFAAELRGRTGTPVEVMLQATDVERFRPAPADPAHAHDVVVVAKSRDVFRASVADALAAGIRPAIYGSGWEPFVDPALVVSSYVANEDLPIVYSSAGVLLNDHWKTMHEWGFVSNRLFDALACDTPVISDDLPEIAELFDGAVLTYRDARDLRALVRSTLADPQAAKARAARGRQIVLARHTFEHRAQQFLEAVDRLKRD